MESITIALIGFGITIGGLLIERIYKYAIKIKKCGCIEIELKDSDSTNTEEMESIKD